MDDFELEMLEDDDDILDDVQDTYDEEFEDAYDSLNISEEDAERNYEMAGKEVSEDPSVVNVDAMKLKYPDAFSSESEAAISAVIHEQERLPSAL